MSGALLLLPPYVFTAWTGKLYLCVDHTHMLLVEIEKVASGSGPPNQHYRHLTHIEDSKSPYKRSQQKVYI